MSLVCWCCELNAVIQLMAVRYIMLLSFFFICTELYSCLQAQLVSHAIVFWPYINQNTKYLSAVVKRQRSSKAHENYYYAVQSVVCRFISHKYIKLFPHIILTTSCNYIRETIYQIWNCLRTSDVPRYSVIVSFIVQNESGRASSNLRTVTYFLQALFGNR